ncbi:hypothetical protein [Microbacterium maritypicum]
MTTAVAVGDTTRPVAVLLWWAFLPWLRSDQERRIRFLRKVDAAG